MFVSDWQMEQNLWGLKLPKCKCASQANVIGVIKWFSPSWNTFLSRYCCCFEWFVCSVDHTCGSIHSQVISLNQHIYLFTVVWKPIYFCWTWRASLGELAGSKPQHWELISFRRDDLILIPLDVLTLLVLWRQGWEPGIWTWSLSEMSCQTSPRAGWTDP